MNFVGGTQTLVEKMVGERSFDEDEALNVKATIEALNEEAPPGQP